MWLLWFVCRDEEGGGGGWEGGHLMAKGEDVTENEGQEEEECEGRNSHRHNFQVLNVNTTIDSRVTIYLV